MRASSIAKFVAISATFFMCRISHMLMCGARAYSKQAVSTHAELALPREKSSPEQQQHAAHDYAIESEDDQAMLAHPVEEPLHDSQGNDERDRKANQQHDPILGFRSEERRVGKECR